MLRMPRTDRISTEWKDIHYYDVHDNKLRKTITRDEFEKMVGDTFEAMQLDKHGEIKVIWTTKYIFKVRAIKLYMTTDILTGYLRNWS